MAGRRLWRCVLGIHLPPHISTRAFRLMVVDGVCPPATTLPHWLRQTCLRASNFNRLCLRACIAPTAPAFDICCCAFLFLLADRACAGDLC